MIINKLITFIIFVASRMDPRASVAKARAFEQNSMFAVKNAMIFQMLDLISKLLDLQTKRAFIS